jgi:hypothetical protein
MQRWVIACTVFLAATTVAFAKQNVPILYPDNSYRYAYGYSGFDYPVVYVQRGHVCSVVLDKAEELPPTEMNGVLLDDRVRWVAVASRAGGQRMPDGGIIPVTWTIAVEPAKDADDAWLTINTAMGNRYTLHLIAVDRHDSRGEQTVGFYHYHTPTMSHLRVLVRKPLPQRNNRRTSSSCAVHHKAKTRGCGTSVASRQRHYQPPHLTKHGWFR